MSALALFIIGPVFHTVESYVLADTEWILALPFGLAGLVLGGIQQIIVVTGVHHVFNLLEANLISNTGKDPLNAIITAAMTAQAGATLAVGVKTKDSKLKALAFPASLSAVLGITEPAIFGVNLRFGKPFIMGLIAGAAGGCHRAGTGGARCHPRPHPGKNFRGCCVKIPLCSGAFSWYTSRIARKLKHWRRMTHAGKSFSGRLHQIQAAFLSERVPAFCHP